jgi:hypothetical protein
MLRDTRLSIEVRGALAMIVSYPNDWTFNLPWFCREAGVGRDKAWRLLRELEGAGYCQREQGRKTDGSNRFASVEYLFSDEPLPKKPRTEKPGAEPSTGLPYTENTGAVVQIKRATNTESKRSSELKIDDATKRPAVVHRFVSEAALDRIREIAPGWDRQAVLRKFLDWPGSKEARDMNAAFLAWVKSFTKGKAP